jgi:hypothetical protein
MSIPNCGFDPFFNFWRHLACFAGIPMSHRVLRGQSPTHRAINIYGP